jgi:hypothetical protein
MMSYLPLATIIGAVAEIVGGCLVLAHACRVALNHRGAAYWPLEARIAWREKHKRFLGRLARGYPHVREDGTIEGADMMRVVWSLFYFLFGSVLLAAGIVNALP